MPSEGSSSSKSFGSPTRARMIASCCCSPARHRAGTLPPPFAQQWEDLVGPIGNSVWQSLFADHPHEQVLFCREVAEDLTALGHVADAEIGDLV